MVALEGSLLAKGFECGGTALEASDSVTLSTSIFGPAGWSGPTSAPRIVRGEPCVPCSLGLLRAGEPEGSMSPGKDGFAIAHKLNNMRQVEEKWLGSRYQLRTALQNLHFHGDTCTLRAMRKIAMPAEAKSIGSVLLASASEAEIKTGLAHLSPTRRLTSPLQSFDSAGPSTPNKWSRLCTVPHSSGRASVEVDWTASNKRVMQETAAWVNVSAGSVQRPTQNGVE